MRRRSSLAFLLVTVVTVLLAAPALAVETMVSNFKLTFYGFVQTDVIYSDKSPTGSDDSGPTAPPGNSFRGQHDNANISARTSRVGFRIDGPAVAGAKSSGQVEFDFRGDASSGAGGSTVNAQPRLRLFKFALDWGAAKLTAGQFRTVLNGVDDTMLTLAPGLRNVVNSGIGSPTAPALSRMPQVRLNLRGGPVEVALGVHRPEQLGTSQIGLGSQSGLYGVHTGIKFNVPGMRGTFLEVAGEYNRQESNPTTGSPEHATGYVGIVNFGTRLGPLGVRGQAWFSQNAFAYDHTFGQGALASTTTAGNFSDLHSRGGWVAATVDLTRDLQLNAGLGIKDPKNDELRSAKQTTTISQAGVTTNFSQQWGYWINAIYALGAPTRIGVEWVHTEANYFNGGTNGSINSWVLGFKYFF